LANDREQIESELTTMCASWRELFTRSNGLCGAGESVGVGHDCDRAMAKRYCRLRGAKRERVRG